MGRKRRYHQPLKAEWESLVETLPHPLRIVNTEGDVLFQNRRAEESNGEASARSIPIVWQKKEAKLLWSEPSPKGLGQVEDLEARVDQLTRSQRDTARKKQKAEKKQQKLEQELDKLQARLNKALQDHQHLEKQLAEAQAEDKSHELAEVQKELKTEQKLRRRAERDYQKLEQLNSKQTQDIRQLEGQVEELHDLKRERESEFKSQRKSLETALKEATEELEELKEQRLPELEKFESTMLAELEDTRSQLETLRDNEFALQEQIKKLKAEAIDPEEMLVLREELVRVKGIEKKLQAELNDYLANGPEVVESAELVAEVEQLRERRKELEAELDESRCREKQQLSELEELRKADRVWELQLEAAARRTLKLQQAHQELRDELEEERRKNLAGESAEVLEQLAEMRTLKEEQTQTLRMLRNELEDAKAREKEQRETLKSYSEIREQYAALKENHREVQERMARLECERDELKKDLETQKLAPIAPAQPISDADEKTLKARLDHARTQLQWTEKRLSETEKKLDVTTAELAKEKQAAASAKETQRLAFEDSLTGLPNINILKKYLDFTINQAQRYKRIVAVLVIDLDHFRIANDTLTMEGGDELLRAVGQRLHQLARKSDVLARRGEDEFVLMLSEIDNESMVEISAQRILGSLAQPFTIGGQDYQLTASVGVSLFPATSTDSNELLRQAEMAVYLAKDQGRGRACIYTPELKKQQIQQKSLENQLRVAIEREEFELVYQPVVDLYTRKVVAFEALLRWNHRSAGQLLPDHFLPVAEKTGLILPLGFQTLERAAGQLHEWRRVLKNVELHFNLSHRQLLEPRLTHYISQILQRRGLTPASILFDVCEVGPIRSKERFDLAVNSLSEAGFRIALDDFGEPGCRFLNLRYSKFEVAKITVDNAKKLGGLFKGLNKELGVKILAKRVQKSFKPRELLKNGFDLAQGFAIAEPMSAYEATQMIAAR